jgi:short-subunit dehydrogenase
VDNMINCNIMSCTKMTAICLPRMLLKRKGVIINNASSSARIPTPLLAVYSASKAYVDFFSRALNVEYESKGIVIQSVCPHFVATKLSRARKSLMSPTPDDFVASALLTVGRQSVTNGCLVHNLKVYLIQIYNLIHVYLIFFFERRKRNINLGEFGKKKKLIINYRPIFLHDIFVVDFFYTKAYHSIGVQNCGAIIFTY